MKNPFVACSILLTLSGPVLAAEQTLLSLRDAIATARRANPTLLASRLALTQAKMNRQVAEKDRGPNLGIQSDLIRSGTGSALNPTAWNSKVTLSQSLFDAHKVEDELSQAALSRDKAEADRDGIDLDLQYEVARAYMEVLRTQALEAASETDVKQAKAQEEIANLRLQGHIGTMLEVLQARSLVAGAEDRRLQAIATMDITRLALESDLGESLGARTPDEKTTFLPLSSSGASMSTLLAVRPELRSLEATRRIQNLTVTQKSRAKLPTLTAYGNVTGSPFAAPTYGATGTALWTLFDSGRLDIQIEQARLDAARASALLDAGKKAATFDLMSDLKALERSQKRIPLTQEQLDAANQALELARLRYGRGVGTSLEMIQAVTTLNQSETAAITARFDEFTALLKMGRAMALPVDSLIAPSPMADLRKSNEDLTEVGLQSRP